VGRSVVLEAKRPDYPQACQLLTCPPADELERGVFLVLLGTLLVLHWVWFGMMLKKGYREIFGSGSSAVKKNES
jgi:hypothetical protein